MLSLPRFNIDVGDRATNFLLPDENGAPVEMYARSKAGGTVLFFVDDPSDPVAASEIAKFAAKAQEIRDAGATLFVITGASTGENARLHNKHPEILNLLSDSEGKAQALYRASRDVNPAIESMLRNAPPRGAMMTFILDPIQRVLEVFSSPQHDDHAEAALAVVRRNVMEMPEDGQVPVIIVPDVIDRETCETLISLWRESNVEGMVSNVGDDGAWLSKMSENRRCRDHVIRNDRISHALTSLVCARLVPEIEKAFAVPIRCWEPFYIVGYDAERGDYFRPHTDNGAITQRHRQVAMTLSLNAGEYEGGGVRFPEYSSRVFDPPAGGAVLFSCSLLHEAVPVERGLRLILSGFMWSEGAEQFRRNYIEQQRRANSGQKLGRRG